MFFSITEGDESLLCQQQQYLIFFSGKGTKYHHDSLHNNLFMREFFF